MATRMSRPVKAAAAAAALLSVAVAHAESAEANLKVAFLFNFAKFVTWPEPAFSTQSHVTLCVHGNDPFGSALGALKDRTVQNRPLQVRMTAKLDELKGCDIAFVGAQDKTRTSEVMQALSGTPVLTVSDQENFNEAGGMITLVTENNKVGFLINLDAVNRADLRISAQLLKVARGVQGKNKP